MNAKIAAIAITIIVAVPIILGYALAFEEETVTGWRSSDPQNVTDLMINSETPYYLDSVSVANNSELVKVYNNNQGELVTPGYVSVGSTYTSIPIMVASDSTLHDDTVSTTTTTSGTVVQVNGYTLTAGVDFAADPTYTGSIYITSTETATLYYNGGSMTGTNFGPFVAASDTSYQWGAITTGSASNPDSFRFTVDNASTFTVSYCNYYGLECNRVDLSYYTLTYPYPIIVRTSTVGATLQYYYSSAASNTVTYSNGALYINDNYSVSGMSYIDVAAADAASHSDISYTYTQVHSPSGSVSYSVDLSSYTTTTTTTVTPDAASFYAVVLPANDSNDPYGYIYARWVFDDWSSGDRALLFDRSSRLYVEVPIYHDAGTYAEFPIYAVGPNSFKCAYDTSVTFSDMALLVEGSLNDMVTIKACKWVPLTYPSGYDVSKIQIYGNVNARLGSSSYPSVYGSPGSIVADYDSNAISVASTQNGNAFWSSAINGNTIYVSGGKYQNNTATAYIWADSTESHTTTWVSSYVTDTTAGTANTKSHITWSDLSLDGVGYFVIDPKVGGSYVDSVLSYNGGYEYFNQSTGYFVRDSSGSFVNDGMSVDSSHFDLAAETGVTFTITTHPYYDIDSANDYSLAFVSDAYSVKLTHTDSSVSYVPAWYEPGSVQYSLITKTGNIVTINGTVYNNISAIAISSIVGNFSLTEMVRGTDYADPSYGWTLEQSMSSGNQYWLNGSVNKSVRMLVNLDNGESVHLVPVDSGNVTADGVWLTMLNDNIYLGQDTSSPRLGEYSKAQIVLTGSSATVSGIKSWPELSAAPQTYNTLTVDFDNTVDDFTKVFLDAPLTVEFRVESANIMAGTFPSIKDNTLHIGELFPDKNYTVRISSSGIYGDSVTFGGQTFAVSDGAITISGSKVQLLQAVFSTIKDENGQYVNAINGNMISTTPTASDLTLGGEWSLTLAASDMEEVERTELVWQPGEFAFNGVDSDFALMGLLGCIVTFIALGMYGARSGAKVGTLMIICGCAAFVFLALI